MSETTDQKITRLRAELKQARQDLLTAEAELVEQLADVEAFEYLFEAHAGHLVDRLAQLEAEVDEYMRRIKQMRYDRLFDSSYRPVDEQFDRTWHSAPSPKQEKPKVKNDAYRAGSMVELMALAEELEGYVVHTAVPPPSLQATNQMAQALQEELARIQRRLYRVDDQLTNLPSRPMVALMVEVKFGKRKGRDVLAEMAADLERKIARKEVERDMIKSQFDHLA